MKATPDRAAVEAAAGDKPALLMLSHCVPQDSGFGNEPERARAWALLRLVSRTHRVFLVCVHDAPVRLADWRALRQHAERVTIESPTLVRRLLGRTISLFDRRTGREVQLQRDLSGTVGAWASEIEFDAVVATHASLWRYAEGIEARVRLCDETAKPASASGFIVIPDVPTSHDEAPETPHNLPLAA